MSEAKHTPGPWVVEDSRARSLVIATKEFVIAQVLFAGVEPDDTDEANARLIAAAPNMLTALKAALPRLINDDSPGGCDGKQPECAQCAAIANIRAAIAEAQP